MSRYTGRFSVTLFALVCLIACQGNQSAQQSTSGQQQPAADTARNDDQIIMALLYQERAAEYRALCLQCYNLAKLRLDEALKKPLGPRSKPLAVVTDLDETAIDNSANEAWLYQNDSAYFPPEFDDWSTYGQAGSVPGSVDFFKYVNSRRDRKNRKITIFYISNRTNTPAIVNATMHQMDVLGFPQLVDSQFRFKLKDSTSSKEGRRLQVEQAYEVAVLLGDNLIDLSGAFDNTADTPALRLARVDSLRDAWGDKYIVFPNAEYGDWEKALYPNGKYTQLSAEKADRLKQLKSAHWK
jgi:5'-nucleotidase (lipoprotein e(P4) family)